MASNDSNGTLIFGAGFGVPTPHFQIGITLYALISFTSVVGNGLVFAAFSKSSKIRNSRTNYLIVSLSCADILAGSVAVPLYTYLMAIDFEGYNDSSAYFVYQFTDVFSITASVWHLAFISLERYFAIVWPVIHHISNSTTYFIAIAVLWIVSVISSGLSLQLYKYRMKYIIYNSAFLFGLPLVIIVSCYLLILKTTIRRSYVTSRRNFERELKVSCTVFILIALFIICWCPFYVLGIISAGTDCNCVSMSMVVYFKALHFVTTCVNPVVYAARIPDFRTAFKKMLPKQIIAVIFCLLHNRSQDSPPASRGRASSTLSTSLHTSVESSRRRPTLLENKAAVDQLAVGTGTKDSPLMASSVTSNKCVTFLSDSPSSATGVQLAKV